LDDLSAQTAIVGKELANYLGIFPDSQILIYSPTGKQHLLKVVGIFSSGMYDYDMKLAFCNLQTAQEILGFANQVTAVGIRVAKPYLAGRVRDELAKELDFNYNLKTWMEVNQNFFAALKLEKLTMFIILALIILVAAFNIASSLIVMVVEKTKDIGILRAQGMTSGDIRRIFTLHGLLIGGTGTLFGFGIGLALCWLLEKYQFEKLPQDVYYLDKIPVSLQPWPDLALIVGVAMLITLMSTVYPANKAAGLKPVEALRYE
jgi:lipoprotein-releasing system permease protein